MKHCGSAYEQKLAIFLPFFTFICNHFKKFKNSRRLFKHHERNIHSNKTNYKFNTVKTKRRVALERLHVNWQGVLQRWRQAGSEMLLTLGEGV